MRVLRRFRIGRGLLAAIASVALASLGMLGVSATAHAAGSLPCDVYSADGTPCVAAYSMDRALYSAYNGPLYQVKRASDGAASNVGLLSAGGDVNAAEQDSFCAGTTCTVSEIYDQSPEGNNLTVEGAGGAGPADSPAVANALPVMIGGHEAYGLDITPGTGYRDDTTKGIAVNGQPEGMYMVASGTNVNSGCCFDFGNAETSNHDTGAGHMDAVNLTTYCEFSPCSGPGPWVEADMENGQYVSGNGSNPSDTSNNNDFVTAMLSNNGQNTFALQGGNAQSGGLTTYWDGSLPSGYQPMHQEGAIVLGTGGDNSQSDVGSFFEGVMTQGSPSAAAQAGVQASIVSAGYAGSSSPSSPSAAGQAVVHSGYSSVYTVDASSGDLQESYLPAMGDPWSTQNLSANYGTPPVMTGTEPVAVTHYGYTSVYTVDAANGHLQETYLPAIGDAWSTQDLSAEFGTPPTKVTPTAVLHDGYTSVYTVDSGSGHLQETYLPQIGDSWSTQDLSVNYGTPAVAAGTQPEALVHTGFTSVYTVDAGNGHLQETYLPAIGDAWSTQDLSANYGAPAVLAGTSPVGLLHPNANGALSWTSVYSVDAASSHLQETYLPAIGDPWTTQDLSANYGTPPVGS